MSFEQLFEKFRRMKVVVLGDTMLDTYLWGDVERISPEAPVPVVALKKREYRIGGAGNVALNIAALGAKSYIISIIGEDSDGENLRSLLEKEGIDTGYIATSGTRITTNKIRVISRNQQMMRLDAEQTADIETLLEEKVLANIKTCIAEQQPDILVFEDYNKGLLTESLISKTIAACKEAGLLTAVDPKRKNFFAFKGVDIFKPNLKEAREGLNVIHDEVNAGFLEKLHNGLHSKLAHTTSLITLSEKGIYYNDSVANNIIPTHVRSIADVSGAGDTVIAVAALVYAATRNIHLAAEMANIAGGLVCEEVGTVAINKDKLLNECQSILKTTG